MKKALLVASRAGFIAGFEKSNVKLLQDMDYEVHVLGDFDMESCSNKEILGQLLQSGIVAHDVKICRNPLEKQNITAYKEIKKS